ncbi:MAG: hypothetical protein Q4P06_07010 [Actinomycetaceae bacterium]|nr:hypothetical protein [Actinomycetaceae bacterium]
MLFLALGLAVISTAGALYLRVDSEKARTWERTRGLIDEPFAFVFLPSFALALWALVVISAANLSYQIPALKITLFAIGVPLAIAGTAGVIMGLFGTRYPQWLIPTWRKNSPYRKSSNGSRGQAKFRNRKKRPQD